jgi:3D (Asp-Asp-Asp) domain-containing protein
MAFHISGKLCALGVALAVLITAFSVPTPDGVPLQVSPLVNVLDAPRELTGTISPVALGPIANPRYTLRATAYNSLTSQTDSTPHITATGARTRFGIIAVSRDMLVQDIPYGSLVRIRDLGNYFTGRGAGAYQSVLDGHGLFVVEDTMHQRKTRQVDVWFPEFNSAISWGIRRVEVEVIRYGRNGPTLQGTWSDFEATPQLLAATR